MKPVVSFIIVNRGGKDLPIVIDNIKRTYYDFNKEILIINQGDDKPFLRGQLFNIGVKYATGQLIALQDNDIFHLRKVPWIEIYSVKKRPLIGFKAISQITYTNNEPIITSTELCLGGYGGFNFMSKSDFIGFNGFSNLFVGWGYEDNEYSKRFVSERVPQNLGHLTHPRRMNLYTKNKEMNLQLYHNSDKRDKKLDGIKQTTFREINHELIDQVDYITVADISVCDNYAYTSILNKQWELVDQQR